MEILEMQDGPAAHGAGCSKLQRWLRCGEGGMIATLILRSGVSRVSKDEGPSVASMVRDARRCRVPHHEGYVSKRRHHVPGESGAATPGNSTSNSVLLTVG